MPADRLRAHGVSAHLEVRDAWAEPDRQVDALFCGFWLSHVPRDRLAEFLAICRRWLKPGGTFAFIDSRPDPNSSAAQPPDASRRPVSYGVSTTAASSRSSRSSASRREMEAALARPASRPPA